MKKVVNISLAGRSYTLEEDAYSRLSLYLENFRRRLSVPEFQTKEVMDEIEARIAELFSAQVGDSARVVSLAIVENVAAELGMPDGSPEAGESAGASAQNSSSTASRKLYRDMDNKSIAGVCAGLALYLGIDITLVRVVMILALVLGSAGFWIYLILWLVVPKADTPSKKCEMHGIPATAENMSRFARGKYNR